MRIMDAAGALRTHKYAVLLALLLVMLAIQSLDARPGAGRLFAEAFRTVLGVAILVVVFERRRERAFMAAILAAAVAVGWGHHLSPAGFDYALSLALRALMSLYLWLAVWAILRDLFGEPAAGASNVLGAICGYVIAGDAWANTNGIAYLLVPAAYSVNPEVNALLADWEGRLALFLYYSFAQMLTIGYADVTPVRAPATTLSLLGALFGLFYTAIVVSQFVGLAQSGRRKTPS
jgi:ion channel